MRIGHWQLESKCGDFDANLAKGLEQAQPERVEVVCLPECFLTGYSDSVWFVRRIRHRGRQRRIEAPGLPPGLLGLPRLSQSQQHTRPALADLDQFPPVAGAGRRDLPGRLVSGPGPP